MCATNYLCDGLMGLISYRLVFALKSGRRSFLFVLPFHFQGLPNRYGLLGETETEQLVWLVSSPAKFR